MQLTRCEPTPEMQKFFEKKVKPIMDSLFFNAYQFDLIRFQFNRNLLRIRNFYGKEVRIALVINPPEFAGGQKPVFCCQVENGQPIVVVVVPNLMASYEASEIIDELYMFPAFVVIGLMHELDHHALRLVPMNRDISSMIEAERKVWARTCKETIVPLVEIYHQQVGPLTDYYNTWVECGRDATHPAWYKLIQNNYGFIADQMNLEIARTDAAIVALFG